MFFNIVLVFVGIIAGVNSQLCGAATPDQNCQFRCQSNVTAEGGILPSATNCADTRTDCALLFECPATSPSAAPCAADPAAPVAAFLPDDPTTYPKVRAPGCDSPNLQDIAFECARTCAICCETPAFNCEDDDTGVVDCQANRAKCTDAAWTNIMAQYCPSTCGLCTNGTCSDINSGCASLRSLCRDVDFVQYMATNCARTCDACTTSSTTAPGGCTDLASNCATNRNLCTNALYQSLMQTQCCATCASGSGGSCSNADSNCGNWVSNGFCTSTFYTPAQKRQYCAQSCNLC